MSEYLVEAYVSRRVSLDSMPELVDLSRVADQLAEQGETVKLTRTILVPEDEVGFFLFEARSAQPVLHAAERVGLRVDRIVEAVSI